MKKNSLFDIAEYGKFNGWVSPPYDDNEILAYGVTVKEYRTKWLSPCSNSEDVHRIEDQIGEILFWKRKEEYDAKNK